MRYRKKPTTVDAWKVERSGLDGLFDIPLWLANALRGGLAWYQGGDQPYFTIKSHGGEVRASEGMWIIRQSDEDIYPCDDEVFQKIYEPADTE